MKTMAFGLAIAAAVGLIAEGWGHSHPGPETRAAGFVAGTLPRGTNATPRGIVTRRVWAGIEWLPEGSPSPDGRYLTFVDWNTGDLAIREVATGGERHITNLGFDGGFAENSRISPDGRWVAYTWYEPESDSTNAGLGPSIRVIPIQGGESRMLVGTENRFAMPFDWSADGGQVLVGLTRPDGVTRIGLVDVDDAEFHLVTSVEGARLGYVAMSPDARYVAYDRQRGEGSSDRTVHIVGVDGRRDREVTAPGGNSSVLGWEPTGRHLLYYGDHSGSPSVWALPTREGRAQGEAILVRSDLWHLFPLGFTAAGDFFYAVMTGRVDMLAVLTDPATGDPIGEPQSVTPPHQAGTALYPRWSPDGRYLAYRRTLPAGQGLPHSLVIRDVESGEYREIRLDLSVVTSPDWSTDGRYLLVYGQEGRTRGRNRAGVYRVDVQTGEHEFAHAISGAMRGAAWIDDGRTVVYKEVRMGEGSGWCRFVTRELSSGREREIYRWPCRSADWWWTLSPDRRTIAGVFGPAENLTGLPWTLRLVSLGDGASRDLAEFRPWVADDAAGPAAFPELYWTPDSRSFRFRGCISADQVIPGLNRCPNWSFDVVTGERRRLADDAPMGAIHPDGRRVAFADGETAYEVWVMENYQPALEGSSGRSR